MDEMDDEDVCTSCGSMEAMPGFDKCSYCLDAEAAEVTSQADSRPEFEKTRGLLDAAFRGRWVGSDG